LVCLGRHAITGLLCTSGGQLQDWSADCRLFSEARFDPADLFAVIRRGVLNALEPGEPLVKVSTLHVTIAPPTHLVCVRELR